MKGKCNCSGIVRHDERTGGIYCCTCGKEYDAMPEWIPIKVEIPAISRRQLAKKLAKEVG